MKKLLIYVTILLCAFICLSTVNPLILPPSSIITNTPQFKLIGHRGGIVEGRYPENTQPAIQAAIDRRYHMLEVDIRESKDGKLVVHHDTNFRRFYGDDRMVAEMTWDEISKLQSIQGKHSPVQFYEVAALCKGKIQLMIDTKVPDHPEAFYEEMERVLRENELLDSAFFIGTPESKAFFKGKAKISINYPQLEEAVKAGEAVDQLYFLFEHGNELTESKVDFAQQHGVTVVPSVNIFHYNNEDHMSGAYRDITWLKEAGVTYFQIDSEYDRWLLYTGDYTHGPVLGHVNESTAHIWARAGAPGKHTLYLLHPNGDTQKYDLNTSLEKDLTLTWVLKDLEPNTLYKYSLDKSGTKYTFRTRPANDKIQDMRFVIGSCAEDVPGKVYPVWEQIQAEQPDALILIGDTPYIDATNLDYQQRRYREFYSVPQFYELVQQIPFYSIWDDHDFGKNDTDGNLPGKEQSRYAFTCYRPNPSFGSGGEAVYTHFRVGTTEVFLLDTRWFAGTEPSQVDPDRSTLLGETQWNWLKEKLLASEAPFKLLASGMIWNNATRPNKPDHWGSYPHEKERLFSFIKENEIKGVMLVGGDIHRSRYLLHSTEELAGYKIPEFITSPLHDHVMESADAPHPDLVYDSGVGSAYMLFETHNDGDLPLMEVSCKTADGKTHFEVVLDTQNLE